MERSAYLTVYEAAELLRVHPQVIYRMIKAGDLPHLRVGRVYRIPRTALDGHVKNAASA